MRSTRPRRICRRLLAVAGTAAVLLAPRLAAGSVLPLATGSATASDQLAMELQRSLDPVASRELAPRLAEPLGARHAGVDPRLEARLDPDFPALATVVRRTIPDLWQVTLPADTVPELLEITYALVSARGDRGRLSHRDRDDVTIEVRVVPTAPIVVDRDEDVIVVEGGVVLELDLGTTRFAGSYLGTVTTTITDP